MCVLATAYLFKMEPQPGEAAVLAAQAAEAGGLAESSLGNKTEFPMELHTLNPSRQMAGSSGTA